MCSITPKVRSSAPYFTSSKTSLYCQSSWSAELYLFDRYLRIEATEGNCTQIAQIMCRTTEKVILGLQLCNANQMRSYSRVNVLWSRVIHASQVFRYWDKYLSIGSSVSWVRSVLLVFGHYSNLGNWVQIPKIMWSDTWKVIQSLQLQILHQIKIPQINCRVFNFIFHIKWGLTKVSNLSEGWGIPVSGIRGLWWNWSPVASFF